MLQPCNIMLIRKKYLFNKLKTTKLCTAIEFPEVLNLCDTVTGPNKSQSTYSLYAISNHLGSSFQHGHYTTHCRHPKDDKWFVLNDSNVSLCSNPKSEIFSSKNTGAYILFYKREEKQRPADE